MHITRLIHVLIFNFGFYQLDIWAYLKINFSSYSMYVVYGCRRNVIARDREFNECAQCGHRTATKTKRTAQKVYHQKSTINGGFSSRCGCCPYVRLSIGRNISKIALYAIIHVNRTIAKDTYRSTCMTLSCRISLCVCVCVCWLRYNFRCGIWNCC